MRRVLLRFRKRQIEEEMLNRLEYGLSVLERLLPQAREDLKRDHALVDAGKAKRIDDASLRHLSSHPQYIHVEESFCPIRPEKIYSLFSVDAKDTYENRFVATLIRHLSSFVEQRYVFARDNPSLASLVLYFQDEAQSELYFSHHQEQEDKPMVRLAWIRSRAIALLHSSFYKALAPYGEVFAPIHPTNVLLKNPDYHDCLELFDYIEEKKELGVDYAHYEEELSLENGLCERVQSLMNELSALPLATFDEQKAKRIDTPEILFSLEETCLNDGEVLYSFFRDLSPINPAAIPTEEIIEERRKIRRLIKRQKEAKEEVSKKVSEEKDRIVMERIAKRKEKRP